MISRKPEYISIAVTSVLEHIIALTLIFPKLTIPLRIFSSSLSLSEVSSSASDRSFMLIFERLVFVLLFTNEDDNVSNAVIGLKTFSIIRSGTAINAAVATLFLDA